MKKMKSILAIAVLSSSLALEAARPVAETERMMKDYAYQGVWLETHHDEALKVAFSTNGWMIVDYRGCPQLFKWKSNGKGLIELAPGEKLEKTVMKLKYLPKQDIMDCGFEGKTTQLDFTGRLAFKSTELAAEHAEALREATAKHERYREERFERLKKSGDPRFRRVENLNDILDPNWLARNRVWGETVDLEYPQIITSEGMTDKFAFIRVIYGARGIKRAKKHELYDPMRFSTRYDFPPEEIEDGCPQSGIIQAKKELEEAGAIKVSMFRCEHGEGSAQWQEEGFTCYFGKADWDAVARILKRHFSCDHPRHIYVDKLRLFKESGMKAENKVGSGENNKDTE